MTNARRLLLVATSGLALLTALPAMAQAQAQPSDPWAQAASDIPADTAVRFGILPKGYGVPPGSPTEQLLFALGRHGQRPAHIHFFVSDDAHRKLTTQINIEGDPLVYDDFAYATRDGLVPHVVERSDSASIAAAGLEGPFAEIVFDFHLTALVDGVDNQICERPRVAA